MDEPSDFLINEPPLFIGIKVEPEENENEEPELSPSIKAEHGYHNSPVNKSNYVCVCICIQLEDFLRLRFAANHCDSVELVLFIWKQFFHRLYLGCMK